MLYVATERPGWLVVGGAAVLRRRRRSPTTLFGHVQNRVDIWLDPMAYYDETPPAAASSSRRCSAWPGAG